MALPPRNFEAVDERFHTCCCDCAFCEVVIRVDQANDPTLRAEVTLRPGALFNKYQVGGDLATIVIASHWITMAEQFVRDAYEQLGYAPEVVISPTRHTTNKLMIETPTQIVTVEDPSKKLLGHFTMSFDTVSPPSGNRNFAIYNVLITAHWEKIVDE